MDSIRVMINGLPGKVATTVAEHVVRDERFSLVPFSLTGPEIEALSVNIGNVEVELVKPQAREEKIAQIKQQYEKMISVDYTHPSAVNENCEFYCKNNLPFVMGTTGGDRERLVETVKNSSICAVIAPNMAKQIVGFQAMVEYAAENFPGLFTGYSMRVVESHQKGKADTSGTAKAMVRSFQKLGVKFSEEQIEKVRDPEIQEKVLGIPREYLGGHGWHTYTLTSPDGTVRFEFTHNINGREIYVAGTLDAVIYLDHKLAQGTRSKVFSMIDVLKGV